MSSPNFFHHRLAKRLVDAHIETSGIAYNEYEGSFNQRVETLSKSLVFLMIPTLAFMLGLITLGRGEYAVKHLVFSCHAYAHLLLFNFSIILGVLTLLAFPFQEQIGRNLWELIFSATSLLLVTGFFYFGLRRAYQMGRWISALFSILLGAGVYFILLLYRAILFLVTYYSLS